MNYKEINDSSEPEPLTFDKLSKMFDEAAKPSGIQKQILVPKSVYDKPGFKKLAKKMGYKI